MLQTFKNAWKVPELKSKILFTLMILLLYRVGANLYVPYVNVDLIEQISFSNTALEFLSLISGGALAQASFFALSVSPYITASIVIQLLTVAIPALERLSKEGEEGKKKLTKYTRILTVVLSVVTAYGYVKLLSNYGGFNYLLFSKADGFLYYFAMIVMIACFCAGASIIMWMAEQIDARGIGNGISMILFANIISGFGMTATELYYMVISESTVLGYVLAGVKILISLVLTVAAIGFIVWFTNSERRIPIQYAKRVVGRKMYGGQASNLPLKLNMAGVMPVIFASSIVSIPATIAGFTGGKFATWVSKWLGQVSPIYIVLNIALILLFSYFYIMISFNPIEVSNNIRSQGGSVPGIRPGKPTADYIKKILNRITLLGAIFLLVIQVVPMIINAILVACNVSFTSLAFTGTSLLIVVGVALETVRDMEAQLAMRNYKGFLD
ncbi:MAG: preprotein translocase subunit SecY [Clostridia bacterium]|nr:preprotein translocase subunit SecY [Clostridia bacterium]